MDEKGPAERTALRLAYFTVGYNVLEGVVAIVAALVAGSTALLGFGVDSFVESLSGAVMIWRFSGAPGEQAEKREQRAVRLVGLSLLALAVYVAWEASRQLYYSEAPDRSPIGLVIAVVSLVVMPVLFVLKRRAAARLGSRSLRADAQQTLACVLLSVALLAGLGLHYLAGWWEADPIAALVICAYLLRESYEAFTERELCTC